MKPFFALAALLFTTSAFAAAPSRSFTICEQRNADSRSSLADLRLQLISDQHAGAVRDIDQVIAIGHSDRFFAAVHVTQKTSRLVVYKLADLSPVLDMPITNVLPIAAILGPTVHAPVTFDGHTVYFDGLAPSSTSDILDAVDLETGKESAFPFAGRLPPAYSCCVTGDHQFLAGFNSNRLQRFDDTTMAFAEPLTFPEAVKPATIAYVPGTGLFGWRRDGWTQGNDWSSSNDVYQLTGPDLHPLEAVKINPLNMRVIAVGGTAATGPFALINQQPDSRATLDDTRWMFNEHLAIARLAAGTLSTPAGINAEPVQGATIQSGHDAQVLFLNHQGTQLTLFDPVKATMRETIVLPTSVRATHALMILSAAAE